MSAIHARQNDSPAPEENQLIFAAVDKILEGAKYRPIPDALRTPQVAALLNNLLDTLHLRDRHTGLPAYPRFTSELETILQERRHNREKGIPNEPCTIVFCDMNHFKSLNDRLGMRKADSVIKAVAQFLRKALEHDKNPQENFLARYKSTGDEFLIIMKGVTREQAEEKMQIVARKLARVNFEHKKDGKAPLFIRNMTMTFGCYELDSKLAENKTSDTIISAIDKAEICATHEKKRKKRSKSAGDALAYPDLPEITSERRTEDASRKPSHRRDEEEEAATILLLDDSVEKKHLGKQ